MEAKFKDLKKEYSITKIHLRKIGKIGSRFPYEIWIKE
jgi:hypothetical protein